MINLKELIAAGESSHLELKAEQVKPDDLAKEIVALLNFQGGKILIGVEDDGTITGVSRPDIEEWVINICRNNVVPAVIPGYQKLVVEDKSVVILDIPAGLAKPYHTQKGDYYVRAGSTARKASREELSRLFQDSGMIHFVEKLGRGIPMVVREMRKLGVREPDFIESGEEFSVILYRE